MDWEPRRIPGGSVVYSFESQRMQYPVKGDPGIGYFAGEVKDYGIVDCLLFRDKSGELLGVLNHYPKDAPNPNYGTALGRIFGEAEFIERAGNINIFIHPLYKREGIASALLDEAQNRWEINFQQQQYTDEGADFIARYLEKRENGKTDCAS
jgi:GNAT superfamily N-acetyltransferase